ncbi:hypothetical protein BN59_02098 [Legionella massiliensis]|uniref:Uncharacterized protein n=1 Tax=Legionella massiliensis TaxID=1034943 RepID=A0A078L164_9GAMM|nr:hypothetical protein BN59_02098 [Legionella massiliensis]CEE13546.1 hypothetical protein BN1094_02098 [Legionella massiliensis]
MDIKFNRQLPRQLEDKHLDTLTTLDNIIANCVQGGYSRVKKSIGRRQFQPACKTPWPSTRWQCFH